MDSVMPALNDQISFIQNLNFVFFKHYYLNRFDDCPKFHWLQSSKHING